MKKGILNKLISNSQKGFVSGRYIGEESTSRLMSTEFQCQLNTCSISVRERCHKIGELGNNI
jgi:hypothetical protein